MRTVLLFLLSLCIQLFLSSCGFTEYEDYKKSQNIIDLKTAKFAYLDSVILSKDSSASLLFYPDTVTAVPVTHEHRFKAYQPMDSVLVANSDSSAAMMVEFSSARADVATNPIRVEFKMVLSTSVKNHSDDYYWGKNVPIWDAFYTSYYDLDVFGCADLNCTTATQIVFHDRLYNDVIVLEKENFKFSKKDFEVMEDDDCSEYTKEYSFNLKIDHPRVKLDADMQFGSMECRDEIPSGNWG